MKLEDIKKEMPKTPEYFQPKMPRKQNGAELVWQQSPQFVF